MSMLGNVTSGPGSNPAAPSVPAGFIAKEVGCGTGDGSAIAWSVVVDG
jgi:hypothetical protein